MVYHNQYSIFLATLLRYASCIYFFFLASSPDLSVHSLKISNLTKLLRLSLFGSGDPIFSKSALHILFYISLLKDLSSSVWSGLRFGGMGGFRCLICVQLTPSKNGCLLISSTPLAPSLSLNFILSSPLMSSLASGVIIPSPYPISGH